MVVSWSLAGSLGAVLGDFLGELFEGLKFVGLFADLDVSGLLAVGSWVGCLGGLGVEPELGGCLDNLG